MKNILSVLLIISALQFDLSASLSDTDEETLKISVKWKTRLLPGVPRNRLKGGQELNIRNVSSYFGPITFYAVSGPDEKFIEATVECNSDRKPEEVIFRLPHPEGIYPVKVSGGEYDTINESVIIRPFSGKAKIRLEY
ncbi:MAG TPA: hypothetical protein DF818_10550 [Bacteroidales bacterium]|nr:hypothetical protein [Bacteroidales bacterium]